SFATTIDTSESNGLFRDFIPISQIFGFFNCAVSFLEAVPILSDQLFTVFRMPDHRKNGG
ncbi:MAG: hypothetical protein KAT27_05400, partial [Desulfobacterales bacterium]|nr:hypothetical protein [Desulfobacterales bacterium]